MDADVSLKLDAADETYIYITKGISIKQISYVLLLIVFVQWMQS